MFYRWLNHCRASSRSGSVPSVLWITLKVDRDPQRPITGAQLHGAVVNAIDESPDEHTRQSKPFSVWPLLATEMDRLVRLRVAWLVDDTIPAGLLNSQGRWRFGSMNATTCDVEVESVPFKSIASTAPTRASEFTFYSPTYFSRSGRDFPLPDPHLVFGSLVRRWNSHCVDFPIGRDLEEAFVRHIAIDDFSIESQTSMSRRDRSSRGEHEILESGFVGRVAFKLHPAASHEELCAFAAMSQFADIAGVGAQTTHGFGACSVSVGGFGLHG